MSNKTGFTIASCVFAIVALAGCTSESTRTQSSVDPFQPLTVDSSPVLATSTAPADPANDTSEEGIRLNILQADKNITYAHLKKDADRYDGDPWAFTGTVFQIQAYKGQTIALVSLDTCTNKMMFVRANFTTDFAKQDQVYIVGRLAGNHSYTSVGGREITVPVIDARAILTPSEAARIKASKEVAKS